ncbi:hypothetical protein BC829DRAFT_490718 [Chytridium lagenaria]|nr:hypothetical protein BC829DRAFT_490718 [Chytridium lagenaria]
MHIFRKRRPAEDDSTVTEPSSTLPTLVDDEVGPARSRVPSSHDAPSAMVLAAYDVGLPQPTELGAQSGVSSSQAATTGGRMEEGCCGEGRSASGASEGASGSAGGPSGSVESMRKEGKGKERAVEEDVQRERVERQAVGMATSSSGGAAATTTTATKTYVFAKTAQRVESGEPVTSLSLDPLGFREQMKSSIMHLDTSAAGDVGMKSPEDIHHLLRGYRDMVHSQEHIIEMFLNEITQLRTKQSTELQTLKHREMELLQMAEVSRTKLGAAEAASNELMKRLKMAEEGAKKMKAEEIGVAEREKKMMEEMTRYGFVFPAMVPPSFSLSACAFQSTRLMPFLNRKWLSSNSQLDQEKARSNMLESTIIELQNKLNEGDVLKEELAKEMASKQRLEIELHALQQTHTSLLSTSPRTKTRTQELESAEASVEEERHRESEKIEHVIGRMGDGEVDVRERFAMVVNQAEEMKQQYETALTRIKDLESAQTAATIDRSNAQDLTARIDELESHLKSTTTRIHDLERDLEVAKEESTKREQEVVKKDIEISEATAKRVEGLERVDVRDVGRYGNEIEMLRKTILECVREGATMERGLDLEGAIEKTEKDVQTLRELYQRRVRMEETMIRRLEESRLRVTVTTIAPRTTSIGGPSTELSTQPQIAPNHCAGTTKKLVIRRFADQKMRTGHEVQPKRGLMKRKDDMERQAEERVGADVERDVERHGRVEKGMSTYKYVAVGEEDEEEEDEGYRAGERVDREMTMKKQQFGEGKGSDIFNEGYGSSIF